MRHLVTLTTRELRAHAWAGALAASAAALSWLTPWLPGTGNTNPADLREATSLVVAVLVVGGLSLSIGSGLAARDLAEGRLGFFLTLPVRAATVWASRLIAGCLVVYGALALVLLPAIGSMGGLLVPLDSALLGLSARGQIAIVLEALPAWTVLLVPLVLVLVSHQLAVALRARSAWLLVELVVVAGAIVGTLAAISRLFAASARTELLWAVAFVVAGGLATLAVGGGVGLAGGRVMPVRFHRAQVLAATCGAAVVVAVTSGWAWWVTHPSVGAVARVLDAVAPPTGDWVAAAVALEGRPSYEPWALYNQRSGAWLPLLGGAGSHWGSQPSITFAGDARGAVWVRPASGSDGSQDLVWVDLQAAEPRLVDTLLQVPFGGQVALSEDGAQIAIRGETSLAVSADGGRAVLASVALPELQRSFFEHMLFVGSTLRHGRVVADDRGLRLEIRDLDVAGRKLRTNPPVGLGEGYTAIFGFSPSGDRLLVDHGVGGATTLHDGATGALLAEVAPRLPVSEGWVRAAFLSDGRVIAPNLGLEGDILLHVFSPDGVPLQQVSLGAARRAVPLGEPRENVLFVAVRGQADRVGWKLREVDLGSGTTRNVDGGFLPMSLRTGAWRAPEPLAPPGAQLLAWDLKRGALVALDPDGTARAVLPAPR
jgi:hypothetical protein